MLRFFKSLFNTDPSLDYKLIDDPRTFQKPVNASPVKQEPNVSVCVDAKEPLLQKTPEGPKR